MLDSVTELKGTDAWSETAALTGRRVRLRALLSTDTDPLYAMSTCEENLLLWRFRGTTPNPDTFRAALWNGVLCQFVIEQTSTNEMIGLVSCYNADLRNGTGYLALLLAPNKTVGSWGGEATLLFINHLFTSFPFRKLYGETGERNFARFSRGAGRYFEVEGRLRAHEYHDEKYWDIIVVALYRERWQELIKRRLRSTLPADSYQSIELP